ncbi:MAG: AAA family ATPase [Pseudotabrizicola sp.]|uniref:bifunctional aminoglycoside phosphotransferase/ATP-binding protein n=1 Tax=Pseudotabrizicola sp. TaxID=2939647 RepID=UPI002730D965|nr:bifunctional aminoglycoside phosphotransferase/ATP-binding protein [Pseudotabrizicola sp.]MDP2079477.1 AAA family ATPase [Pseudotabrizicola sp.]MDZ7576356.1 AAA family ATPase [Pseudotabrizicola sp.]
MSRTIGDVQNEVLDFLQSGRAFADPGAVDHVQTHCAHIFLCGDAALKIKRAVRYDYLDQSTPDLRHALLYRELSLNKPTAPMIYRDVVPITRSSDGGLEMNGAGSAVEWALRMNRFSADCEMTEVAASGRLTDPVAAALGQAVQQFHAKCPALQDQGDDLIRDILDELGRVLTPLAAGVGGGLVDAFLDRSRQHLSTLTPVLRDRSALGHVKRVHGDLHLRNLLLIDGRPVLFDALEFDERLATCDVLYDTAFLLMDLCHRGLVRQANIAMTAYLLAAKGAEDAGLSALPFFLSVRAAIRAMVLLQTDQVTGRDGASAEEVRLYLKQAASFLETERPILIAIGGFSGTGKTVLSRDLAPKIGPCPGAVHLRTDTERKSAQGHVDYAPPVRGAIYDRMFARAATLLVAGRSVVLDGTFLDEAQRVAAVELAAQMGVAFHGLWLTAPERVLIERVTSRVGDASDADAEVVRAQLASAGKGAQRQNWVMIDASGSMQMTRFKTSVALEGRLGPEARQRMVL